MAAPPLEQFVARLTSCGLLTADDCQSVLAGQHGAKKPATAEELARELVAAGKLTKYQATAAFQGHERALLLGDYIIVDKIGAGGMGQVLKAQHRRMKRVVALKVLPSSATKTPDNVKRFQREVEAAARLLHPNIVAAFDAGQSGNTHFLVMEFVDGQDLSAMVRKQGALPVDNVIDYMLQAARGLAYAHGEGVVHRDIKPGNLLVDKKGTLKILDMGLARFDDHEQATSAAREGLTHSGQVMGTVDYMAPEQAFDTRKADARADIYSLGCSMYRLLTGENAYEGETLIQKILAHRDAPIPTLRAKRPDAPATLDDILARMMAKKPEDRYQTMDDVATALTALTTAHLAPAADPGSALDAQLDSFMKTVGSAQASATTRGGSRTRVASKPAAEEVTTSAASVDVEPDRDSALATVHNDAAPRQHFAKRQPTAGSTKPPPSRKLLIGGGAVAAVLVLAAVAALLSRSTDDSPEVAVSSTGGTESSTSSSPPPQHSSSSPAMTVAPFDAQQARAHQEAWARHMQVEVESSNSLGMKLMMIPPGDFMMGTNADYMRYWLTAESPENAAQEFRSNEVPAHRVRISRPFLLAAHEVTVGQFEQFADATGYQTTAERRGRAAGWKSNADYNIASEGFNWRNVGYKVQSDYPVGCVSHDDGVAFCNWLSQEEGLTPCYTQLARGWERTAGNGYRLPTEAEWEYACRAGTIGLRVWPDNFGDEEALVEQLRKYVANGGNWVTDGKPALQTRPIGTRAPNPFGLYDVFGNVSEICSTSITRDYSGQAAGIADPAPTGSEFVARGPVGFWLFVRSAIRNTASLSHLRGLRVARELTGDSLPIPRPLPEDEAVPLPTGGDDLPSTPASTEPPVAQSGETTAQLAAGPSPMDALSRDGIAPEVLRSVGGGDADNAPGSLVAVLGDTRWRHCGHIYSLAWASDGRTIVSGGSDNVIRFWDVATGYERAMATALPGAVRAVVVTSDGQTVVTGNLPGHLRVWDAATGQERSFSPLGEHGASSVYALALHPERRVVAVGSGEGPILLWDFEQQQSIALLEGHQDLVRSLAFSRDGKLLASTGKDETVRLWDVPGQKQLVALLGHEGDVNCLALHPAGTTVVSAGDDRTLRWWDVAARSQVLAVDTPVTVEALCFIGDGSRLVVAGDNRIVVWNTSARQVLENIELEPGLRAFTAALRPDGKALAVGTADGAVAIYDATSFERMNPSADAVGPTVGLKFSSDGSRLAAVGADRTLRVWDTGTASLSWADRGRLGYCYCLDYSPDGQWIAVGNSSFKVNLWNTATRQETLLVQHLNYTTAVAFHPDSRRLASGDNTDGAIALWDVPRASVTGRLPGHTAGIAALAFHPAGQWLASASADGTVRLWNLQSNQAAGVLDHPKQVYGLAFSPAGDLLATSCGDGKVRFWDSIRAELLATLPGGYSAGSALSFNADGSRLAYRVSSVQVAVCDVPAREVVQSVKVAPGSTWMNTLALDPTGRYAATGNLNGTVYLLQVDE